MLQAFLLLEGSFLKGENLNMSDRIRGKNRSLCLVHLESQTAEDPWKGFEAFSNSVCTILMEVNFLAFYTAIHYFQIACPLCMLQSRVVACVDISSQVIFRRQELLCEAYGFQLA